MASSTYWQQRRHLMYYRYIDAIMRGVAADARSLLDVGSANARYLDGFKWITTKIAIDIRAPYSSPAVQGITIDFFDYKSETKFDIVTCLQVLEHIPDAEKFARKLFEVGRDVLISVPYKWPKNSSKYHVHDPVDRKKLRRWTGRDPTYSIVAGELFVEDKGRRLIAYYQDPSRPFVHADAIKAMRASVSKPKS